MLHLLNSACGKYNQKMFIEIFRAKWLRKAQFMIFLDCRLSLSSQNFFPLIQHCPEYTALKKYTANTFGTGIFLLLVSK